jgi:hypothetical protein
MTSRPISRIADGQATGHHLIPMIPAMTGHSVVVDHTAHANFT